jgi:hypothetical protein
VDSAAACAMLKFFSSSCLQKASEDASAHKFVPDRSLEVWYGTRKFDRTDPCSDLVMVRLLTRAALALALLAQQTPSTAAPDAPRSGPPRSRRERRFGQ